MSLSLSERQSLGALVCGHATLSAHWSRCIGASECHSVNAPTYVRLLVRCFCISLWGVGLWEHRLWVCRPWERRSMGMLVCSLWKHPSVSTMICKSTLQCASERQARERQSVDTPRYMSLSVPT